MKVENCVKQQADKLAKENKPFFRGEERSFFSELSQPKFVKISTARIRYKNNKTKKERQEEETEAKEKQLNKHVEGKENSGRWEWRCLNVYLPVCVCVPSHNGTSIVFMREYEQSGRECERERERYSDVALKSQLKL